MHDHHTDSMMIIFKVGIEEIIIINLQSELC